MKRRGRGMLAWAPPRPVKADCGRRPPTAAALRVNVPFGLEEVEAVVLGVHGDPAHLQVRLALEPDFPDQSAAVEFVLHISELPTAARRRLSLGGLPSGERSVQAPTGSGDGKKAPA